MGFLTLAWQRRWWIVVTAAVTAAATAAAAFSLMPVRYRSQALIMLVPQRVPADYVRSAVNEGIESRLPSLTQQILSRTRLERTIHDFGLYGTERESARIEDIVRHMRANVAVEIVSRGEKPTIRVSFVHPDARTAMKVTERLSSMIVEENLRDREVQAEGTIQFIESQAYDARRQLVDEEQRLEQLRKANGGRPLTETELLPYEVLKDTYRSLLVQRQESIIRANLERRQIGEQLKVIDAPRLPERPIGPSRTRLSAFAGFVGGAFGLVVVAISSRRGR